MRTGPLLFNGAMVRATLAGQKTNTRRTNGLEYYSANEPDNWRCVRVADGYAYFVYGNSPVERVEKCPYGKPNDRLWVRETCHAEELDDGSDGVRYTADEAFINIRAGAVEAETWHKLFNYGGRRGAVVPSIHMPRWASRILLEITSVRVERLQDVSEEDAKAEGCEPMPWPHNTDKACELIDWPLGEARNPYRNGFALLWECINGYGSWAANPWVWVVEFRRIEL